MSDRLFERLGALRSATPSTARATRVRARCRRALARHRRAANRPRGAMRYFPHVIAGLGGLYFAESVRQVLTAWGLL